MSKIIKLPVKENRQKNEGTNHSAQIIHFRKKTKCPSNLEWARGISEYQKTKEFKNWIGYYQALGKQKTERDYAAQQRNLKTETSPG